MRTTRSRTLAGLGFFVVLASLSGQASVTVAVGTCTSLANYATIQQAVNSVPSGATIKICPGTYHEQVAINQPVTLTGIQYGTQDAVVILPPATGLVANTVDLDNLALPIAAQVWVHDTAGPVNISNLTVDGTGNQIAGCAPDLQGILFQSASGMLDHVAVRAQTLGAGLGGCQSGESIYVQTGAGLSSVVTVENSSVHAYNKNGITGNDAGTSLTVTGNYVQGAGIVPVPGAAQNGIQLGFGATGKITSNTVIDNVYGDPTIAASADVLLYDTAESSGVSVSSNTLGNSQLPVVMFTDAPGTSGDGVSVTSNKIFGTSAYDAIDVCTNGNTVTSNTIFDSAESGVHLDASCGGTGNNNSETKNTSLESACAGILADTGTTGNTTSSDTYYADVFTTTSSASRCTIPTGLAAFVRLPGTTANKVSPAR